MSQANSWWGWVLPLADSLGLGGQPPIRTEVRVGLGFGFGMDVNADVD